MSEPIQLYLYEIEWKSKVKIVGVAPVKLIISRWIESNESYLLFTCGFWMKIESENSQCYTS